MSKFPHYTQTESKDCGPTSLKIIAKHYDRVLNIQTLRELSETTREGSNLLTLSDAAENIGFRTLGVKLCANDLQETPLPCILHWNKNHYVVLYKIKKGTYYISDPAIGLLEYSQKEFIKFWIGNNADETTKEGIVLLLEPTPNFYEKEDDDRDSKKAFGFGMLSKYVLRYKSFIVQLIIGLFAGSLLQLIFPFLTQSVVDVGIQNQNIRNVLRYFHSHRHKQSHQIHRPYL